MKQFRYFNCINITKAFQGKGVDCMKNANALLRTDRADANFENTYYKYIDMVYRICFMYMKNISDTEDCVQDTFLKYLNAEKTFKNDEHEKAWLIITSSNICKNKLKHWWNKRINIDEISISTSLNCDSLDKDDSILNAVLSLPEKYKLPIYLHYYSGYKTDEIAKILRKNPNTIRTLLSRGRNILKEKLE